MDLLASRDQQQTGQVHYRDQGFSALHRDVLVAVGSVQLELHFPPSKALSLFAVPGPGPPFCFSLAGFSDLIEAFNYP